MNEQEIFMIEMTEYLVKYKKKYRKLLYECDELKRQNKILLNANNRGNDIIKKENTFGNVAKEIFIYKNDENIHPKLKQEINP